MTQVIYRASNDLPNGVPAVVIAQHGRVTILLDAHLSIEEACAALTPLVTAHAGECWHPRSAIA